MSRDSVHPAEEEHEQRDVNRPALLLFAVLFAGFIAISVAALWLTFGIRQGGFAAAQPRETVPANGELDQRQQLANYLSGERSSLERLAWTDAGKTKAKVPIEDAMRLLAAKGASRLQPGTTP